MSLVLDMVEGSSMYVGHTRVKLEQVYTPDRFKISVDGPMIKLMEIDGRSRTEIMSGVFLAAGKSQDKTGRRVKFMVDAPQHIKVLREKLYFEKFPDRKAS